MKKLHTHSLFLCIILYLHSIECAPAYTSPYAAECPCISPISVGYSSLQSAMVSSPEADNYGLDGCQAYDNNTGTECAVENPPAFCTSYWCYVDMDVCPINTDLCEADKGARGLRDSKYCRTRDYMPTTYDAYLPATTYYSYSTCGYVDLYPGNSSIKGFHLQAAVTADEFMSYRDPAKPAPLTNGWSGVLPELVYAALNSFMSPAAYLNLTNSWATEQSMKHTNMLNSYTACVYDVGVGNYDL